MENKNRWLWIPAILSVLLLGSLFACTFWRGYIQPKASLASALTQAFSQLEERFGGDPLLRLAECYSPNGQYAAQVKLDTSSGLFDTVAYDMTVEIDTHARRLRGDGKAKTANQEIALSLYLDPQVMAVSSEDLADDVFYGITYKSFGEDIRKVPLLNLFVNEDMLNRWDASVQAVRGSVDHAGVSVPSFSYAELKNTAHKIVAMPCERERADITVNGFTIACDALSFTLDGGQVPETLSNLTGERFAADTSAVLTFYLYENTLVRTVLSGTSGEKAFRYSIDLGLDPVNNPLSLQGSFGEDKHFSTTINTRSEETRYAESWDIQIAANGKEANRSFAFEWNPKSGEMKFHSGVLSEPLVLTFQRTEEGFFLKTDDLGALLGVIQQKKPGTEGKMACALEVSKGGGVAVPSIKNLDQWSTEDFLRLLGSVGSLVGIQLEA